MGKSGPSGSGGRMRIYEAGMLHTQNCRCGLWVTGYGLRATESIIAVMRGLDGSLGGISPGSFGYRDERGMTMKVLLASTIAITYSRQPFFTFVQGDTGGCRGRGNRSFVGCSLLGTYLSMWYLIGGRSLQPVLQLVLQLVPNRLQLPSSAAGRREFETGFMVRGSRFEGFGFY